MESIEIRELRQNASRYVRRLVAGDTFTITDHGRPVGLLTPLPRGAGLYEQLIASGELIPAIHPNGMLSTNIPEPLDLGFSASEELQRMRAEERW